MICDKRKTSSGVKNGLDSDDKEDGDVTSEGLRGPKLSRLNDDAPVESGDRNLETEFNTLKTLIPGLSERTNLEELDIIDACVLYIQALRNQLCPRSRNNSCRSLDPTKVLPSSSGTSSASEGFELVQEQEHPVEDPVSLDIAPSDKEPEELSDSNEIDEEDKENADRPTSDL
ncbi:hypothetical protein TCAL_00591 [Tigriopus californicus]|uniref:BHLH domain-containing protein n=1 Tax=Tigriopus californicus TaxID=6832 RepID=A0A553PA92_TIGCA|nr:uncharacterized protein LOC131893624 [Tigriopus californicus]TRY74602.1 hypothetical protein TCAL_00591 [Tigriopus californicus]|eukprot:TCALIF_00591-PA protein Name:"Protein of unknown function" AED:0.16 eAED:0.16 QI:0/1/0.5/1/1/1/2/115/172